MTTHKKSGTAVKPKPKEEDVIGTPYDYGADLHTDGTPLIDPGTGKTVSIRTFTFKIDPTKFSEIRLVSKQAIFDSHAKQITTLLWGDGLVPLDSTPPRVIIDPKKNLYYIFVPCEARLNTMFIEKPKNLSEQLTANHGTGKH